MTFYLKDLAEKHLDYLRELRSDPRVADWLFSPAKMISPEQQMAWYKKIQKDDNHLVWVAYAGPPWWQGFVGYAQIYGIDNVHGTGEIGVVVAPDAWGKGIGTQIVIEMLERCFENVLVGMNTLVARVLAGNLAAIRLFTNCGFSVRGWLPEAIYKNGQYRDVVIMSITRREYVRIKSMG